MRRSTRIAPASWRWGITEFDEFLTDMSITNPAMMLSGKTVAELQAKDPEKYSYHATAVFLAKQVAQ